MKSKISWEEEVQKSTEISMEGAKKYFSLLGEDSVEGGEARRQYILTYHSLHADTIDSEISSYRKDPESPQPKYKG